MLLWLDNMNESVIASARLRIARFIPALIWWAFTFWLLTLPGSKVPAYPWMENLAIDKWAHVFIFAVCCIAFYWPFKKTTISLDTRKRWFLAIALIGCGYGIAMEFVQKYYVINRAFELGDILADTIGCAVGWWWGRNYALQ
ncbi:MAG: VanZ family protein [Sediminibacterium sp.]|nr:VanZ family protein [Sediminibacterium sp.]